MVQQKGMILDLSPEQAAFQREVAALAAERIAPAAAGIDADGHFPRDLVAELAARGLLGVTIPKAWGGAGRDYPSYALAVEAMRSEERRVGKEGRPRWS